MAYDQRAAKADAKAEKAREKAMRPWYKKKRFIIPLAFIALILIVAAASGGGDDAEKVGTVGDVPRSEGSATTAASDATASSTFKVGDVVRKASLEATVLSSGLFTSTNQFVKPAAGNKFVAVELQVKNTGTRPAAISSLLQFKLRDSTNAQYDVSFSGSKDPRFPEGELTGGTTNRGFVTFDVPQSATGLQFVFDANVFGGGRITWTL